jgi:hypothetical protein
MSLPDETDEKFELYLKQFRPLAPEPLPGKWDRRVAKRRFVVAAGVVAVAAVLVVVLLTVYVRPSPIHSPVSGESLRGVAHLMDFEPLTVGRANALLTRSPSFKTAIDQIAFQSQAIQMPEGSHSALATLGKEKTKL